METLVHSRDILAGQTQEKLNRTLFLERHPEYPTYYLVSTLDNSHMFELHELVGDYSSVFVFDTDKLRDLAEEKGYQQIIYLDDPQEIVKQREALDDPFPFDLNVELKKFQLQGFNYCRNLKSDIINWSTGTGKSVYAVAKAKYLLSTGKIDKVVVVSKGHNKINWQRQFELIGGLDAVVAEGTGNRAEIRREKRVDIYNTEPIFIINYEKLRFRSDKKYGREFVGDGNELVQILKGQRVYFIWDEMPTRLKNRTTTAWKGANKILKACKEPYQSMLSATPVENSPEDVYACVKLLDPKIFGTLQDFRQRYARSFNPWVKWQVASWDVKKLEELGMRISHMTHVANKYRDPEIRAQFPAENWEDIIIDMSPEDRRLYIQVERKLAEEFNLDPTENVLPKLLILQLICNNPAWLNISDSEIAQRIIQKRPTTDQYAAKLETLHEMLDQIEGKVVLFSMYNTFGSQPLSKYLTSWGITNVLYDGSDRQKQDAQDLFQSNPAVKVFVSSDAGSDSINLEQATTVINFDLPWKYSTLLQRVNRINRITSDAEQVWYFNLINAGTMEERKQIILNKKKGMQDAIDKESGLYSETLSSLSQSDYKYILTGES
jgi:SNF2 family DNA or RNA helicase